MTGKFSDLAPGELESLLGEAACDPPGHHAEARLINELRDMAIAAAGSADFLVTGDKRDVLALGLFQNTKIVTVRDFLAMHRRLPWLGLKAVAGVFAIRVPRAKSRRVTDG